MEKKMRRGKYDEAVLAAVYRFWLDNCYPPTLRWLMAECGISSTSTVGYVLRKLEKRGEIEMRGGHPVPRKVIIALSWIPRDKVAS
jgi:hypothetical protein